MTVSEGATLTCTNESCGCRLRVEVPCPHGDQYTCACGHPFGSAGDGPPLSTPGA